VEVVIITRNNRTFDVLDDAATSSWGFWRKFAKGDWETFTLDAIDGLLEPDATYLDVGAWVGPTVLWASSYCQKVIAVEPDPAALASLRVNVERNCDNVTIIPAALSTESGKGTLSTSTEWGDSQSSLLPRGTDSVPVDLITIDEILTDEVGLIKIDIEGGEGKVFPAIADRLHDQGCPIILSLHLSWIDDATALLEAIDTFDATIIDNTNNAFRTVLLR
jgi:FkbM family methyltransferase